MDLACFVHVSHLRIPSGAVITRKAVPALRSAWGALAPLFLVAAQGRYDRDRSTKNLLVPCPPPGLAAYSIYCRAQAYSGVLTEVQIPPQA